MTGPQAQSGWPAAERCPTSTRWLTRFLWCGWGTAVVELVRRREGAWSMTSSPGSVRRQLAAPGKNCGSWLFSRSPGAESSPGTGGRYRGIGLSRLRSGQSSRRRARTPSARPPHRRSRCQPLTGRVRQGRASRSGAAVRAATSSKPTPGDSSTNLNPSAVTSMTARSV